MKINFSEDLTRSVYLGSKVRRKKKKVSEVLLNAPSVTFLLGTINFNLLSVAEKQASAQLKTAEVGVFPGTVCLYSGRRIRDR